MSLLIRNVKFDLSPEGIQRAIDIVNDLRNKLVPAMEHLINELSERGVDIAKTSIFLYDEPPYDLGLLHESIRSEPAKDGIGKIYAGEGCISPYNGESYAMYVEYGTGEGFDDGNPDGVGRSGKPMHYMGGWYYFNERDGHWYHTYGMQPRPFMHHTYTNLMEDAEKFGGRILAEYLARQE